MDYLRLAWPAGHAQHEYVAGVAATGTSRCVDWRVIRSARQSGTVLPFAVWRHVHHGLQIAVGRSGLTAHHCYVNESTVVF